jgi:transketolase
VFKWKAEAVDGHDVYALYHALVTLRGDKEDKPRVLIAHTIKGKGIPRLETDPLSHVKSLKVEEIDAILAELK